MVVGLLLKQNIGETPAPTKEPDDINTPRQHLTSCFFDIFSIMELSECPGGCSCSSSTDGDVAPETHFARLFGPRDAEGDELRRYLGPSGVIAAQR